MDKMTEMIPISEIDKLIKAAEDSDKTPLDKFTQRWTDHDMGVTTQYAVLSHLRGLQEKAVPAVTEEKIDAKIKEYDEMRKEDYKVYGENATQFRCDGAIKALEDLKNEKT